VLLNVAVLADLAFNIIFSVELVIKLVALRLRGYVRDPWNCFDALLVGIGYTQVGCSSSTTPAG
jgi:hypothetical protein